VDHESCRTLIREGSSKSHTFIDTGLVMTGASFSLPGCKLKRREQDSKPKSMARNWAMDEIYNGA
jgi:hypothetical protein